MSTTPRDRVAHPPCALGWTPEIAAFIAAANPTTVLALLDELDRLRQSAALQWELDHQRKALERHGLAEEFPFGCDAIGHVAEALLAARAERDRLAAENARLRETGSR